MNDRDGLFLAAIFHADELGIAEAARRHKITSTALHRKFTQWNEEKKIHRIVVIDWHRLGIWPVGIFFALQNRDTKNALTYLKNQPEVLWLVENLGDPRYEATIWCRDMGDIALFFDRFSSETKARLSTTTWSCETGSTFWDSFFFSKHIPRGKGISLSSGSEVVKLDTLACRLLDQLMRTTDNLSTIARRLRVPPSTLHERFNRLRRQGIIRGSFFHPNWEAFGLRDFSILLSGCQRGAKMTAAIVDFSRKIPSIGRIFYCIGDWDFKIVGVVKSEEGAVEILDLLRDEFGERITEARLIRRHKKIRTQAVPFFRADMLEYVTGADS